MPGVRGVGLQYVCSDGRLMLVLVGQTALDARTKCHVDGGERCYCCRSRRLGGFVVCSFPWWRGWLSIREGVRSGPRTRQSPDHCPSIKHKHPNNPVMQVQQSGLSFTGPDLVDRLELFTFRDTAIPIPILCAEG